MAKILPNRKVIACFNKLFHLHSSWVWNLKSNFTQLNDDLDKKKDGN